MKDDDGRVTSALEHRRAAGAMTWRLHAEMVLLAGWGRAILLQLAHPLVAEGVAAHSAFLSEGWGRIRRLSRTLTAMLTLTFGTSEEVERVARVINGIHDRVHGELAISAGVLPARTPYTAHDPALLAWVHATLVDSFLLTYERFVAPLSATERDRYCAEATEIERLLGIPAGVLPRSAAELASYMDAMLASGQLSVTDTARTLAREIVDPPTFLIGWPIVALARLPTVGFLPPAIRDAYGLQWNERRARALGVVSTISRRLLPVLPAPLRHWPIARAARLRRRAGEGRA
jgi:uncharacterized protein (DUF2236 family)